MQQPPELAHGSGSTVDVLLKSDLASCDLDGGERVTVAGELQVDETDTDENVFDYHLAADAVNVENGGYEDIEPDEFADEIDEIRSADDPVQVLVDNFAPHIQRDSRLETVIEALVLQMVGASRKSPSGGATMRGDSHVLVLGDPGTTKSELLEEVEELSPRSELKSGEGLTKAGATAAAVKDDFGASQWSAKAGLMVAANEGVACIDEVDKADDDALNSMHQALENQRVTISKAGINAEMPARTTLLAAGNPKYDRFDPYEPIADQIELNAALMSRFDLLFMLHDHVDESRDSEIADTVIESWSEAGLAEHTDEDVEMSHARPLCEDQDRAVAAIRAYIARAKQTVKPVLRSQEVKAAAKDAYMSVRMSGDPDDDDAAIPVTTRKLEAFLRIAEASARARFSEEVELQDVERANRLVVESLRQTGTDPETGEFDADLIETGQSKSQRDRVKKMKSIVEEVESEYDEGAPRAEIAKRATEEGIDTSRVDTELRKLSEQGEVYEPQDGYYRTT